MPTLTTADAQSAGTRALPPNAIDLQFRCRPWQDRVFKSLKRFSVLVIHRRAGKTLLAVLRLVTAALACGLIDPRYAYIAPQHKQAKAVAWLYLTRIARLIPGSVINQAETWVSIPSLSGTPAQIRIWGADNPDGLRGIYLDGVVLDEFAQMKGDTWEEVIVPALSDRHGWALIIGTPKGINRFSEIYDRAVGPSWFRRLLTVYDTDVFTPAEIDELRGMMSERSFNQEFMCSFEASNEDNLIQLSSALLARGRVLQPDAYQHAAKVLGVDVARFGDDSSVLCPRQGLLCNPLKVYHGLDTGELARKVISYAVQWGADAILVDGTGGYGAGVIDMLRKSNYVTIDVQFGGRADNPEKFINRRAEMAWRCREWIDEGGALAADNDLVRELCAPTYWFDKAGRLQIESKEDLKKRIGCSPDRADALWITFGHDIAPRAFAGMGLPGQQIQPGMTNHQYDPYAGL